MRPAVYPDLSGLLSPLSHIGKMVYRAEARWSLVEWSAYAMRFGATAFALHCVASEGWWVATVLPRALRFKRPLHRCNACNPNATRRRS
jgi:hypothetical protein